MRIVRDKAPLPCGTVSRRTSRSRAIPAVPDVDAHQFPTSGTKELP